VTKTLGFAKLNASARRGVATSKRIFSLAVLLEAAFFDFICGVHRPVTTDCLVANLNPAVAANVMVANCKFGKDFWSNVLSAVCEKLDIEPSSDAAARILGEGLRNVYILGPFLTRKKRAAIGTAVLHDHCRALCRFLPTTGPDGLDFECISEGCTLKGIEFRFRAPTGGKGKGISFVVPVDEWRDLLPHRNKRTWSAAEVEEILADTKVYQGLSRVVAQLPSAPTTLLDAYGGDLRFSLFQLLYRGGDQEQYYYSWGTWYGFSYDLEITWSDTAGVSRSILHSRRDMTRAATLKATSGATPMK